MANQQNNIPGRVRDLELVYKYYTTQILTSGTSFTTGPLTRKIRYRMVGGGGGGGGADTAAVSASAGSGGAAGSYAEGWLSVSPNTAYSYAIGALGAGGTAGANNGSTGGATTLTIDATTITCPGGLGGQAQTAGTAVTASRGGVSGLISTNGDINFRGTPGSISIRISGTEGVAGAGGGSPLGCGGGPRIAAGAGDAATGNGSGGGGALVENGSAAAAGGNGTAGVIIIDEYT